DQARRYKINGYKLASSLQHLKYGLAIYMRNELSNYIELPPTEDGRTTTTSIKLGTLTIVNVYKPPESWPKPALQKPNHLTIYVRDFNSHHTDWGYKVSDANGEALTYWMSAEDVHLVFDAKHHGTFWSTRHTREYNSDLILVSTDRDGVPIRASRHVFPVFPHSQHKPVIIHVGIEILMMVVKRVPRCNLGKVAWDSFEAKMEKIRGIPPTPKNYDCFVVLLISAGKNNIPRGHRKGYIPCWTLNCKNLQQYEQSEDPAAASAQLNTLDAARRQRWIECVESLDFTHSSHRAWGLKRKLGAANPVVAPDVKVKPNAIAAYLVANSKGLLNKQYKQEVKHQLRKVMTACPESSTLSTLFSSKELATILTAMKKGKVTDKDGIPPDFLHHLGPRTRKWLLDLWNSLFFKESVPLSM
uniref:Endonuclease/exonuclease/phosphatase domain-containing protein n=1 Tax=Latimeria chalumnae TaxID=7897 RepID=H3A720_LATCH